MFTDFVLDERITGEVLADAIIGRLTTRGLSLADLRGQCYDGSSNMSGLGLAVDLLSSSRLQWPFVLTVLHAN